VLNLGVYGLIYAQLIASVVTAAAALYFASRYLQATVDLRAILAIFGASVLGYLALLLMSLLALPSVLALVADALVFVVVYFTSAPLVGAIDAADVEMLGSAIGGLGVFGKVLRPVLRYERLILRRLKHRGGDEAKPETVL
jgi:hypothetical protein